MIVHVIHRDKFTNGYIRFMYTVLPEREHVFFTEDREAYPLEHCGGEQTHILKNVNELLTEPAYRKLLQDAEKIIVSGLMMLTAETMLRFCAGKLLRKTYFHLWGGDYYCYREKSAGLKASLRRALFFHAFARAAGLVFISDEEHRTFREITHVSNRCFTAPMPGNPRTAMDYSELARPRDAAAPVRVVVGNSATATNCHRETFELLLHLMDGGLEVYCPLSYGDADYRDMLLKTGKELLGDRFHPVLDYMTKPDYVRFLSEMDIGIFNNDRQQGMGNALIMLAMGKKVYLRPGTSMWETLRSRGYAVFPADEIKTEDFQTFCGFDGTLMRRNIETHKRTNRMEDKIRAWERVLDDEPPVRTSYAE